MIDVLSFIFFFILAAALISTSFGGRDDTDSKEKRSGLSLYTDNKTGLQYLKAGLFGGITPRLTVDGTHMRKDNNENNISTL